MPNIKDKFPNKPATYIIQDPLTGKAYIGSTGNLQHRMTVHISELRNEKHNNQELQTAFNNNKDLEVSATFFEDKETALDFEQCLLNEFHGQEFITNVASDARSSLTGRVATDEEREQSRQRMLGNKLGEGRVKSEEERRKISESKKGNQYCLGRKFSEETIERMRQWNLANPQRTMLGKHHTEETKRKISEARQGIEFTEDHKKKLSEKKSFPVMINGQVFNNAHVAAEALGVSVRIVQTRTNSDNFPDWVKLY